MWTYLLLANIFNARFLFLFFLSFFWQLRKLEAKEEAKRKAAEKEAKAKIPANEYFRGLQVATFIGSGTFCDFEAAYDAVVTFHSPGWWWRPICPRGVWVCWVATFFLSLANMCVLLVTSY